MPTSAPSNLSRAGINLSKGPNLDLRKAPRPATGRGFFLRFKAPSEGLVPIGNTGLYVTPDEPADPTDCDRWPDSPYCGGNPFSLAPVSFEPSIAIDGCNIGIRFDGSIGFIKVPPVSIVYRKPECRIASNTSKEFISPANDYQINVGLPNHNCLSQSGPRIFIRHINYFYITEVYPNFSGDYARATQVVTTEIFDYEFPYRGDNVRGVKPAAYFKVKATLSVICNQAWKDYLKDLKTLNLSHYTSIKRDESIEIVEIKEFYVQPYGFSHNDGGKNPFSFKEVSGFIEIFVNDIDYLLYYYQSNNYNARRTSSFSPFWKMSNNVQTEIHHKIIIGCTTTTPLPKEKCCMSQCCPPPDDSLLKALMKKINELDKKLGQFPQLANLQNSVGETIAQPIESVSLGLKAALEKVSETHVRVGEFPQEIELEGEEEPKEVKSIAESVKLTSERIELINKTIGVDEFPAKAPKRLTYPNGKGDVEIKNIVEFLGYQVKQIDRAVGLLPQKIKVADTNPGLAGNQSVEVEVHSFADFAREIMQYMLDTEGDVDTTNNMLVRALYELGFIHQGVVQADAMLDAICEHLDFKQRWKKIKVPFAFDPHAGTKGKVGQGFGNQGNNAGAGAQTEQQVEDLLPKLLQNTEVDIRVLTNDEKKSLNDVLQDIKRDTAISAAASSEPAGGNRIDQLVAAAQLIIQLGSAVDRKNLRQALTGGDMRTDKKGG